MIATCFIGSEDCSKVAVRSPISSENMHELKSSDPVMTFESFNIIIFNLFKIQ